MVRAMNKYLRSVIVLFVFIVLYEWLVHGVILQSVYQATEQLWRTVSEQKAHVHILFLGHAVSAFAIYLLFSRSDSTLASDFVIFGAFLGLLTAGWRIVMYSVVPYPWWLVALWIIFDIVKYSLVGYFTV